MLNREDQTVQVSVITLLNYTEAGKRMLTKKLKDDDQEAFKHLGELI